MLQKVKINQIVRASQNLRDEAEPDDVQFNELKNSIRTRGLLEPIMVQPKMIEGKQAVTEAGEPEFTLINGLQRLTICKQLGYQEIQVNVIETQGDADFLAAQITTNATRVDTKLAEYAKTIKQLMQLKPTMSWDDVAAMIGKSKSWVLNVFSLNRLPEDVQALVNENKIPATNSWNLANLFKYAKDQETRDQFTQFAQTDEASVFVPRVNNAVKEIKAAISQGRKANLNVFVPNPVLRKANEVKAIYEEHTLKGTSTTLAEFVNSLADKSPYAVALETIKYTLKLDPASVAVEKASWEAAQKKREEAKLKAKADKVETV